MIGLCCMPRATPTGFATTHECTRIRQMTEQRIRSSGRQHRTSPNHTERRRCLCRENDCSLQDAEVKSDGVAERSSVSVDSDYRKASIEKLI